MGTSAANRFDVFLSHNSREKPVVERLANKLKRAGLEPWLDKWCLTPGGRWQEELAAGLRDSAACAVFVGPHDAGDWEREEVGLALDQAAKNRGFRVFLVLLPGVEEPFSPTVLSPFLSTRTWVDLRHEFESSTSFQLLVNAIKGVPLTASQSPTGDPAEVCSYRGLQPFEAEHAKFYSGRDAEIQRLVEQLKGTRFLAVLGPSGSGKSSLVRAGLLPSLANGSLPGSHDWPIHVFTPGAEPLTQLAAQLVRFGGQETMQGTLDRLASDPRTLHLASALAMANRSASVRIVWVVDHSRKSSRCAVATPNARGSWQTCCTRPPPTDALSLSSRFGPISITGAPRMRSSRPGSLPTSSWLVPWNARVCGRRLRNPRV